MFAVAKSRFVRALITRFLSRARRVPSVQNKYIPLGSHNIAFSARLFIRCICLDFDLYTAAINNGGDSLVFGRSAANISLLPSFVVVSFERVSRRSHIRALEETLLVLLSTIHNGQRPLLLTRRDWTRRARLSVRLRLDFNNGARRFKNTRAMNVPGDKASVLRPRGGRCLLVHRHNRYLCPTA